MCWTTLVCPVGNYRDAAACYERAVQLEPNEVSHHEVCMHDSSLKKGGILCGPTLAHISSWLWEYYPRIFRAFFAVWCVRESLLLHSCMFVDFRRRSKIINDLFLANMAYMKEDFWFWIVSVTVVEAVTDLDSYLKSIAVRSYSGSLWHKYRVSYDNMYVLCV